MKTSKSGIDPPSTISDRWHLGQLVSLPRYLSCARNSARHDAHRTRTAITQLPLSTDVVVMDINMPDLNGVEATRQICAEGKGPKVIALTGYAPTTFAVEMLNAGASAYVLKTDVAAELSKALDAVCAGKIYLSPEVSDEVMNKTAREANGQRSVFSKLSAREREVLQLLAEGKATKEVAKCLNVSIKTVESHRRNLMEKLDLHSVAELTKYAIREGITSP